jgi:hypothetical protein
MSALEVWYTRLDAEDFLAMAPDEKAQNLRQQYIDKARKRIGENLFPKIAGQVAGRHHFVDQPPILFHVADADFEERVREGLEDYRQSLSDERRALLDRHCGVASCTTNGSPRHERSRCKPGSPARSGASARRSRLRDTGE